MKRGFTLIELIVSITILMVISVGTMMVMSSFTSKQKIDEATQELVSNLRLARNYAMIMQKPDGFTDQLNYVRIEIDSYGNTVIAPNNSTAVNYFNKPLSVKDAMVTITAGTTPISFSAFEGKSVVVDLSGNSKLRNPGDDVKLSITVPGLADIKTITVNYLGQISVN